jgi:DNA-binding NarL/FixJ family response regulator
VTLTLDPAQRRRSATILIVDAEARVIATSADACIETVAERLPTLIDRHVNRHATSPDMTVDVIDDATALRVMTLNGHGEARFAVTLERAERRSAFDAICDEYRLTRREREVFGMLVSGWSNSEISDRLIIAKTTARDHTENIFRKTGTNRRTELLAKVIHYDGERPAGAAC